MESEKFNPDATCGFRMSECYFEDPIVAKLVDIAWQKFTTSAPEFIDFNLCVLNVIYKSQKGSKKSLVASYLNSENNSPAPFPQITHENFFEFQADIKKFGRKIDYNKIPISYVRKLICAYPTLVTNPVIGFIYMLGLEQARLGQRTLLDSLNPSEKDYSDKKIPDSILLFLFWAVEGLLESLDRITNSPEKGQLTARIVKSHLMEELFFKLLISHPPIKKIALQQSWIILQNAGFDVDPNYISKKINANPLRKEILSKDAFKRMHTTFKQESSFDELTKFLEKSGHRLMEWNHVHKELQGVQN